MKYYTVTTNNPDAAPNWKADKVYQAIDETDAVAQMVKDSNIAPDQCSGHRFRATEVEAPKGKGKPKPVEPEPEPATEPEAEETKTLTTEEIVAAAKKKAAE